jgi:hypothetical protein
MQSGRKHVKPQHIITVGEDALIVSSYTEVNFESPDQQGGAAGMVSQAKQATNETIDRAKQAWESPETQSKFNEAQENIRSTFESGKAALQDVADEAKDKFREAKNDPENKHRLDEMKSDAAETIEDMGQKAEHAKSTASQTLQQGGHEAKEKLQQHSAQQRQQQENKAVGQYITRNILGQNDQIIAKRGQMVTHRMLDEAKKAGTAESILSNLSTQPLPGYYGALGGEVDKESIDDDDGQ